MAQSSRSIPANYPQHLGIQMMKADAQRQASMLRQEILTDLLGVLTEAREPGVRARLARLAESNLKSGISAAQKAENLWPEREHVEEVIAKRTEIKVATAKKHLKIYEQMDRVHHRSLALLNDSFENIRLILDRAQPPEPSSATPANPPKN